MMESGFLWGAATSSHQIEGDNIHNDWWHWEAQGMVEGGVKSQKATDHLHRFKEDIFLAHQLGLNSYRFSLEWSRFEPQEGEWNEAAFDFYQGILDECEKYKIKPMITLQHFTIPQWLAERGGFASEISPLRFSQYVERVAPRFLNRVDLWCTINEPMVLALGSHLAGFMPPGKFSPKAASLACFNLLRCHVAAYDILHKHKTRPIQVGFAHNMLRFKPDRRHHLIEIMLARMSDRIYNRAWLDAVTGRPQKFGIMGVMPKAPQFQGARDRKTVDFIGINYYTKALVQWWPRQKQQNQELELPIGVRFARKRDVQSDMSWAVYAKGFRKVLTEVSAYKVPIYITENGIADRDDKHRASYICQHLEQIAHARAEGADIRGYFHWSLLDNFEWIKGFWPRFGLYAVDYDTMERQARPSAKTYREIIQAHGGNLPPDAAILQRFAAPIELGHTSEAPLTTAISSAARS